MTRTWEIAANAFNAASILLAGLNSRHTWWTGITGCALFAVVFFAAKLYADVTLQLFFILASAVGWWNWRRGLPGAELPVRRTRPAIIAVGFVAGAVIALAYGWLLHRFTDAFAPFLDSVVLAFSVLGQLLLMGRRYETWWCWLLVNALAVPLYAVRGLPVTSVLSAAFGINAVVALVHWRRFLQPP